MAWIVKPSAKQKIERRDEPYLTDAMKTELREKYFPRYETRLAVLLPSLHMVQHAYGWVPQQAMLEIAEFLEIQPSEVFDTATFYEEYWLKPKGRHIVSVCRSIACEVCGHKQITEAIKAHLDIDVGETTEDGEFTLVELECMGSCGTAPVAIIDETLHENLTPERAIAELEKIRGQGPHGHH